MILDTIRSFETPEGIELQLQVAGPVSRASAWLVDSLIRLFFYVLIFILALPPVLGEAGLGHPAAALFF